LPGKTVETTPDTAKILSDWPIAKILSDRPIDAPRSWPQIVNQPQKEPELAALRRAVQRNSPFGSPNQPAAHPTPARPTQENHHIIVIGPPETSCVPFFLFRLRAYGPSLSATPTTDN
jgi:hypothetical protein